ncbi:nucleotidyltransferase [Lactococcus kimchii]|uniref:nucleotidyltransferase n=1 Tax=Lactococcus sp. S-13 TaxID=2507158 RepID=UPI001023205E|nr:nucleotidyltransferase [Lactococcus sp. S-13]RZI49617.1 nucleotidyltransferase [Lactococcus sp. S-13]
MTEITGIIAEFNPFHKGHEYLLAQAKGLKVVAMSGNWMQRGEPAIFDKWTRAEMALRAGADLVVELPVTVSVQSADFFATGAVEILDNLGIDRLIFGSESDLNYNEIAQIYEQKAAEMESFVKNLPDALSYPEKTQLMWQEFTKLSFDGNTPNHVLALAYAKAAAGKKIELETVKRQGHFHSPSLDDEFASATALRQQLFLLTNTEKSLTDLSALKKHIPSAIWALYEQPKSGWDDFFPLLRYQILVNSLEDIFQINQELSVRIKAAAQTAQNFDELVNLIYTKRYTKARVRRLLTYVLLAIPREFEKPKTIHVLGFTKAGQEILAQNKGKIVSKIGQNPWDVLTQKADQIYQLGNPATKEQNYGRKPIILP